MPFHQWILIAVPTWLIAVIMISAAIVTAIGGVLIVRRLAKVGNLKRNHDIAGPIFSTLGVIYAVLLAFAIYIVWQDYDRTRCEVWREANCCADIYRDSVGLPEPLRSHFISGMDEYVNAIVTEEWKLLAEGRGSEHVEEKSNRIWTLLASYEPQTENEKIFLAEILDKVNSAGELRDQRIASASTGTSPVLWFVLLFGGIITVVFTFFFGSDNLVAQLVMTSLLAVLIVLILFTILIMDFPFSGELSVTPDAFKQAMLNLKK